MRPARSWPGSSPRSRACATGELPRPVPERLPNRARSPLPPSTDHQHPLRDVEAPLDQRPQKRTLGPAADMVSIEPQERCSIVIPCATTDRRTRVFPYATSSP